MRVNWGRASRDHVATGGGSEKRITGSCGVFNFPSNTPRAKKEMIRVLLLVHGKFGGGGSPKSRFKKREVLKEVRSLE